MKKNYQLIVKHYENCLEKYGDSHKGVDWPKKEDVPIRYRVMLDIIKEKETQINLLDFGCGASHLYEYILRNNIRNINYSGLDISEKFIELSKKKHPGLKYYCIDILDHANQIPVFDYIVMNGVFTEKVSLSFNEMWDYFTRMLEIVFLKANRGIAFNVLSKHVDWERNDLFYVPFDMLAEFITKKFSRNYIFRNDYLLFEYTTYIYK